MSQHIDAIALAEAIRTGETTAPAQVEAAVSRIQTSDPELNAVVTPMFDEARAAVERGLPEGPLTGVPFLVKDLGVHVKGVRNSRGSRLWADKIGAVDSEIIRRYRQAGLVILGLTNTPELGKNASTEPLLYGPTHNPWKLGYSSGGSSGGSSAAVSAGMVPIAHGNDGGGSVRIPAANTGLYGLKPSRGRSSLWPDSHALTNPTSVAHAVTTTVRDSALLLDVIAGGVSGEPFGARAPRTTFLDAVSREPGPLRIGVVTEAPGGVVTDPEAVQGVLEAAELLAGLGHRVSAARASWDTADVMGSSANLMGSTLVASVNARLAELGRELREDDLEPFTRMMYEHYGQLSAQDLDASLRRAVTVGFEVGTSFETHDVLLTPTMAQPSPIHGFLDTSRWEVMFEHGSTYSAWTSVFNVTGMPAASVPFGLFSQGTPRGVQLVGDLGTEELLLSLSAQLEQIAPWQPYAPGYAGATV